MIAALETAFGIDQHVRDILHVAHLPLSVTHLQQRIVGGRGGVGWIEQEHAAVARPKGRAVSAATVTTDRNFVSFMGYPLLL